MNRERQLLRLARRLNSVGAAQNWRALADLDRDIGAHWHRMVARGAWTPEENAAARALREAHREAATRCAVEVERAKERLDALNANREGWMAYAVVDDSQSEPA